MDTTIRLRWTSHQGTILSVFDALLRTESLVDVTLACEGQYIRAHKVILSACSPYFQDLMNVDLNKHPIFFLKDVTFNEMKALIQYMYRGEVNIPQEELGSLLAVAQALKIRGLSDVESPNNSTSDTIILSDVGRSQPPPPAAPGHSVPIVQRNRGPKVNISDPPSPIVGPGSALAPPPAAKKARVEARYPVRIHVANKSTSADPLAEVETPDRPSRSLNSLSGGYCEVVIPSNTSNHQNLPGHEDGFRNKGMEDREDVLKIEGSTIEDALEDGDDSTSHSSFPRPWQVGDGDNSRMAEDDRTTPGENLWIDENYDESGGITDGGEGDGNNVASASHGLIFEHQRNVPRDQQCFVGRPWVQRFCCLSGPVDNVSPVSFKASFLKDNDLGYRCIANNRKASAAEIESNIRATFPKLEQIGFELLRGSTGGRGKPLLRISARDPIPCATELRMSRNKPIYIRPYLSLISDSC